MSRTGIETIICLSPNFRYVYIYVMIGSDQLTCNELHNCNLWQQLTSPLSDIADGANYRNLS